MLDSSTEKKRDVSIIKEVDTVAKAPAGKLPLKSIASKTKLEHPAKAANKHKVISMSADGKMQVK